MRAYKIRYTLTTHSRHGRYTYGYCTRVHAETKEEAVEKVRTHTKKEHNGQWKFRLYSIEEI